MLKGLFSEKQTYLREVLFAIPFAITASLELYGVFATRAVSQTGAFPDISIFITALIFGSIAISLVIGLIVSRIADQEKRNAVEWAMIALPFGMGLAYIPALLLSSLLGNGLELLVVAGIFIFGGLVAWLLGNWINKALPKIQDERKAHLAKISIAVSLLFLGLIFLIVFYAPMLAEYGLL